MNLLTPAALVGLLLLPLIVLLHLRRRRFPVRTVPSLLVWRELLDDTVRSDRQLSIPSWPLLLLQSLAVAALVVGLAGPWSANGARHPQIFVLDDGLRMSTTDVRPNRLQAAKALIAARINAVQAGVPVAVIVAAAQPSLLISSTDHDRVTRALASLGPSASTPDLAAALRLAGGITSRDSQVLLVHAPEDVVPPVSAPTSLFTAIAMGGVADNQAVTRAVVRCQPDAPQQCLVYAEVRNESDRAVSAPLVVEGDGATLAERTLSLPPHSQSALSFAPPPGHHVLEILLARTDDLPLDNAAWCIVPTPLQMRVALVGDPIRTAPIARALAAVPGLAVTTTTPARAGTTGADLLILDGWLPTGALPSAPALLLIDPPSMPGGAVTGRLSDATIAGTDTANALLGGVDLTALDIPTSISRRLTLPPGVAPVVWAADGPLLAAGTTDGLRLAVLSFDPVATNLSGLDAFPILLRNLTTWAGSWLPAAGTVDASVPLPSPSGATRVTIVGAGLPGVSILPQTLSTSSGRLPAFVPTQPGVYTVTAYGPWGTRVARFAASLQGDATTSDAAPIQLPPIGGAAASPETKHTWWPWLVVLALLAMAAEILYLALRTEQQQ